MGASESKDRSGWNSNSTEEENAKNGRGSTASKILAGAAIGALAAGAYALSSSSSSSSKSRNHNSQPFSLSSQPSLSSSGSLAGNHCEATIQSVDKSWKPPEKNWIKCNVDAFFAKGDSAGCGGVFRDHSGKWILGFSRKLGVSNQLDVPNKLDVSNNTQSELWGIITGISIAMEKGFPNVIVETDHQPSVDMIKNGCKETSNCYKLVQDARSLLDRSWNVKPPVHCYREGNRVAHSMASYSRNLKAKSQEFDDPPYEDIQKLKWEEFDVPPNKHIGKLLEDDLAGVSCS